MKPQYTPRQRWLAELREECLDERFLAAHRAGVEATLALLERPHPGIYLFPLFSERFCAGVRAEGHAFLHWCEKNGLAPTRPNSMNHYGLVLAELGLEDTLDALLYRYLAPLTARLFPAQEGARLDYQHSFLVEYELEGDRELDFHVDDSEVTLNACLGVEFEGGEVYFRGARCAAHRQDPARPEEHWELSHRAGYAALHGGAHRHGVHALRSGRRLNLIAWLRSSKARAALRSGPAPCGPWCGAREAA